jgi:hypothetical protein
VSAIHGRAGRGGPRLVCVFRDGWEGDLRVGPDRAGAERLGRRLADDNAEQLREVRLIQGRAVLATFRPRPPGNAAFWDMVLAGLTDSHGGGRHG